MHSSEGQWMRKKWSSKSVSGCVYADVSFYLRSESHPCYNLIATCDGWFQWSVWHNLKEPPQKGRDSPSQVIWFPGAFLYTAPCIQDDTSTSLLVQVECPTQFHLLCDACSIGHRHGNWLMVFLARQYPSTFWFILSVFYLWLNPNF